jgi:hypothetical protein
VNNPKKAKDRSRFPSQKEKMICFRNNRQSCVWFHNIEDHIGQCTPVVLPELEHYFRFALA